MYLLDTMVLSEGFKKLPEPSVVAWMEATSAATMFVSALTFGEIAAGLEKRRTGNPVAFARLGIWLDETRQAYRTQTLAISVEIAMRWGILSMQLRRRDMDVLIAATALEHDLTIVTRNLRHFEPTGAKLMNPYES